jgi:tRNA(fMet)-specific endonuclease VapC
LTYLLDTNVCIDHFRAKGVSELDRRLTSIAITEVAVCSMVRAELLAGALGSRDPAREKAKVVDFLSSFDSYPFDDAASEHHARVRVDLQARGIGIGANDLVIAAIALSRGLILVSNNRSEFERVPNLIVEDWRTP